MDLFNKQKIKELESQVEKLKEQKKIAEKRMKKEKTRAKEAVTKRQEAEREINILKQKIETLRDKMKKLKKEKEEIESPEIKPKNIIKLNFDKIQKLENIAEKTIENGKTIFHIPELFNIVINFPLGSLSKKRGYVVVFSNTGAVFSSEGKQIQDYKIIKSKVHSKHSKGGFSAGRFERGIEKQIEEHVEKIKNHLPLVKDLETIITGDKILAKEFDCPYITCDLTKIKTEKDLRRIIESVWRIKGKLNSQ